MLKRPPVKRLHNLQLFAHKLDWFFEVRFHEVLPRNLQMLIIASGLQEHAAVGATLTSGGLQA
jgi:hypothetical protein